MSVQRNLLPICSAVFLGFTALWLFVWKAPLVYDGWPITPHQDLWPARAWLEPIIILGFFGGLAALAAFDRFRRAKSRKEQTSSTILSVAMLMLFATVWPWSLLARGPEGQLSHGGLLLVEAFYSDLSNEYFGTAYRVEDSRQFSREYHVKWQTPASPLQSHVATHPPGAVLFFYEARKAMENSPRLESAFEAFAEWLIRARLDSIADEANRMRDAAANSAKAPTPIPLPPRAVPAALWSAFLCSLALGLTVPAIYWIASGHPLRETANEARGLFAAALFAFAPAVGLFAFTLDALIACGAAWTLAFVAKAIAVRHASGSRIWLIGAGVVMGLTSFLSIGALAVAAIVGAAMVLAAWREENRVRNIAIGFTFFGLGFVIAWLLLMVIFPMQPLAIFQNAMAAHANATLKTRTAPLWPLMNLVFFTPFVGWAVVMACVFGSKFKVQSSEAESEEPERENEAHIAHLIGNAALAAIIVLTLSGNVKGEVERLWLFLVPPLCALAAAHIAPTQNRLWLPLLAMQTLQSIIMAAGLAPLVRPI